MTSKQIRQQFLAFFASKGHTIVDSSPVVPLDDPTLMFTNAGMNQFKDVFLGTGSRPYTRVADTQKCIRAGGKHNDLDDVGQDTYHHTFFEMLGNWSFGDYFKKEAIEWAWELLTGVWGIEKDRLHATYFEGDASEGLEPDAEAAGLWKTATDIDPSHIHPGRKKDNFWEMGETGPCGPCSEIHIDLTPDKSGGALVNAGDARVIELWNLVFIQFNRDAGGKLTPLPARHVDTGMGFERLCAVLQGMEQNRIGRMSNYDTDVFAPIFHAIQRRTGAPAYFRTLPAGVASGVPAGRLNEPDEGTEGRRDGRDQNHDSRGAVTSEPRALEVGWAPPTTTAGESPQSAIDNRQSTILRDVSYRVIADHIRCLTFALTDGAIPSNEGRGYVLRRILRRAVRYGRQYMNMHEPFLCDLVEPVVNHMSDAFPELRTGPNAKTPRDNVKYVADLIREEEASFLKTLDRGIGLFEDFVMLTRAFAGDRHAIAEVKRKDPYWDHPGERAVFAKAGPNVIPGGALFKLYDTYGFPPDLTELMAHERGMSVDMGGFCERMERARAKARAGVGSATIHVRIQGDFRATPTDFKYWGHAPHQSARLIGYVIGDTLFSSGSVPPSIEVALVTDATCFYAEQGGQAGDTGLVQRDGADVFDVATAKLYGETVLHFGELRSPDLELMVGDRVWLQVHDRLPTARNHTSSHMLNWALREVLGDHVQQKGSLVDPEKARFDFSHNKPLTVEELTRVENLVNDMIQRDLPVHTKEVPLADAMKIKTLRAVFGEKYADPARVVSCGADIQAMLDDPENPAWMEHPVELCGGTHLEHTGEAERFVLILEEAVGKGVRRLVGITGEAALHAEECGAELLAEAQALAGTPLVAPRATEPSRDREGAVIIPIRDRKGAAIGADASAVPTLDAAAVAEFRRKVEDAAIPLRVRRDLQDRIALLQKEAKKEEKQAASASSDAVMDRIATLLESAPDVDGVRIVVGQVPPAPVESLRGAIDWVRHKVGASAVLLATVDDNRVTLIAGMSKDVVARGVKAGDLMKEIAPLIGGHGGGRPDMAQGGGNDPSGLPVVLDRASSWISAKLV